MGRLAGGVIVRVKWVMVGGEVAWFERLMSQLLSVLATRGDVKIKWVVVGGEVALFGQLMS